jgi:hypothetical protein
VSLTARRACAWILALVSFAVVTTLIVEAVSDLQVADRTASVAGGCAGVIGLALSAFGLLKATTPASRKATSVDVRAEGAVAVAAGGSVNGNAIGDRSTVTGGRSVGAPVRRSAPGSSTRAVAEGDKAVAAGGDVSGNAIGHDSTRRDRAAEV